MNVKQGLGVLLGLAAATVAGVALAMDMTDRMRGAPITETTPPPPLMNSDNSDIRRVRNYAMQPPVIPHKIDNYQLDKNANRCMFCHARTQTQASGAPMISITHYQDRQGNHLAELSPRRYFCTQCHVPQVDLKPLVENRFVDVNELLRAEQQRQRGGASAPQR
ncbi:nitrate reductase cytochrome c-type subunit [Azohydromonas caseinilytica]|uniref:Periplasmic nitrate reductase, electron transfer subunit n=1 Tax=Azohydromonas caseinilytica TaxID=2728836 RepID=A0A848FGC4_9BURK|nr:nitrate reductase cytochrome c-type subunit [Azohydromonas caseinilytica]NML18414.1 nitrate reductase cytochrome c-type subunit [Azohydromonas caseinilytica]